MQKTRKSQLCRHVSPHLFSARPRTVNPVRHGRSSRRACGARTVRKTRDGWAPSLSHLAAAYSQSATTFWETWVRWGERASSTRHVLTLPFTFSFYRLSYTLVRTRAHGSLGRICVFCFRMPHAGFIVTTLLAHAGLDLPGA